MQEYFIQAYQAQKQSKPDWSVMGGYGNLMGNQPFRQRGGGGFGGSNSAKGARPCTKLQNLRNVAYKNFQTPENVQL